MILERIDGPECVKCGCRDCIILSQPEVIQPASESGVRAPWVSHGKAICNHCETRFTFAPPHEQPKSEPVYSGPTCPDCGSRETTCTSSPKPKAGKPRKRYHKCDACGSRFTTEDATATPLSIRTA